MDSEVGGVSSPPIDRINPIDGVSKMTSRADERFACLLYS